VGKVKGALRTRLEDQHSKEALSKPKKTFYNGKRESAAGNHRAYRRKILEFTHPPDVLRKRPREPPTGGSKKKKKKRPKGWGIKNSPIEGGITSS